MGCAELVRHHSGEVEPSNGFAGSSPVPTAGNIFYRETEMPRKTQNAENGILGLFLFLAYQTLT